MKKTLYILILLFVLTGCFKSTPYEAWGEVYVKSSASIGDAGVTEVVDFETKYKQYDLTENRSIPVTVGTGYKYGDPIGSYSILYISVVSNEEELNNYYFEYYNFNDVMYESTVAQDSSFLVIPHYDDFYPKYHEELEIEIPEGINNGYIFVQQRNDLEQPYGINIKVYFEIIDNILYFKTE